MDERVLGTTPGVCGKWSLKGGGGMTGKIKPPTSVQVDPGW